MARIGSLALAFMLFASLGFAWTASYAPPSCVPIYTVLGINFTYAANNSTIACPVSTSLTNLTGQISNSSNLPIFPSGVINPSTLISTSGTTNAYLTGNISLSLENIYTSQFTINITGYADKGANGGGTFNCSIGNATNYLEIFKNQTITGSTTNTSTITFTKINATAWNITSNLSANSVITNNTAYVFGLVATGPSNPASASCTYIMNNVLVNNGVFSNISSGIYSGFFTPNILWSDFKTGYSVANPSNYCRSLLYFNNPYYGNIQLIPQITYISSIDAFANFKNASDNSAYIPNNTISYVYDSVTEAWYIVPATVCTTYATVLSTSTLQYNPTGIGVSVGGTVPFDVNSITGSCAYNNGTRLITCTGNDASGTITSLSLSAYRLGNTTDLCAQTVAGASGTLTCTLPSQAGTYNAFFYGTDANLLTHQFSYKQIQIGSGITMFGRDAYIVGLLLFCVAATLMSSNIAVSMVIGCFGLFIGLALGVFPWSDAPVFIFFAVIAFVIAYRLKI